MQSTARWLRDPFFDPWWIPGSDNLWALVGEVLCLLIDHENCVAPRQRARKQKDEEAYLRMVAGLVSGLAHSHLHDEDQRPMAISLSKADLSRASRYASPVMVKALPGIIAQLASADVGYVQTVRGWKGSPFAAGRRTTIEMTSAMSERIDAYGIADADLSQDLDQETIVLKDSRPDRWATGRRIDYRDTPDTALFRSEMRTINEWLSAADLDWMGLDPSQASPGLSDRLLRRYFNNGTFSDGGRLFGGFWQPMSKADRREYIRITGERVVCMDFGQMAARILYGLAGARVPPGDLYAIPGYERWRDGIKKLFNAMQNVHGIPQVKPKGTAKLLPNRPVREMTEAILSYHAPIAPLLRTMIGPKVMRIESDIIVDVLLRLQEQAIVALPIHDAVVVPKSSREAVHSTMADVFRKRTGCEAVISVE